MSVPALKRATTAILGLALLWPAGASAAQAPARDAADGDRDKIVDRLEKRLEPLSDRSKLRLIVSLNRRATASRVERLEDEVGDLAVKDRFGIVDAVALTATKRQVRELAAEGVVARVSEDDRVHTQRASALGSYSALNDSAQTSFGVTEARMDQPLLDGNADADPNTYSAGDLVAAVVDTGIDAQHVDLDEGKVLGFAKCLQAPCVTAAPYDDEGHGTHVAGTIAGDGDGPSPAASGVAPRAGLVGVKVLDENGNGYTSDVIAGIEWVVAQKDNYGIEALNLSLGSGGCGNGLDPDSQAVNAAYAAGLLVTVAAGNGGPGTCTIGSPGDAKDAFTVGAMADLGANGFMQADFSSRGPTLDGRVKPDISAPGVAITSALAQDPGVPGPRSGYATMNGTSMATPFVTGVALLMQDAAPLYANDDVRDTLTATAVDWGRQGDNTAAGSRGSDIDYGAGRLDAYAALAAADPLLLPQGAPQAPQHSIREGSLAGSGTSLEYTVDVASTAFPVAATLVDVSTSCASGGSDPDFDLRLTSPSGATVASASSADRQDELGHRPATTGIYRLRVLSYRDCGDFFVDVSGGAVSAQGMSGGGEPGAPATPTEPAAPAAPAPVPQVQVVTTAAIADAARTNARRAVAALRSAGLRRVLRRRYFVVRGLVPSAGRVELVVRARSGRRTVTVARVSRRVGSAGQPRLIVRLTAAGRSLFSRPLARRLTVRAAVSDSATGRRRLAGYRSLVRR